MAGTCDAAIARRQAKPIGGTCVWRDMELEICFRDLRHLHQVTEQANLEGLVAVDWNREANDTTRLAIYMVAALNSHH